MKKEELLLPYRIKLIIEYIEQVLSSNQKVRGKMEFSSYLIDNENMCTLNIFVPQTGLEKHINLGILTDNCDMLYENLFSSLLDTFLEHETIGVSRYYCNKDFHGIDALNAIGSKIEMNFLCRGNKFDEITSNYNLKINEYIDRINRGRISSR